jgi:hypothetical protein
MWLFSKSENNVSSRNQIQIKEVKDGILILPGQEYRAVIETSSINFELKSEEEQDVLIDGFQNFLNSLPFSVQILVRVREVDINRYLDKTLEFKTKEKEKVYQNQIDNYCSFIKNLVSGNKILSRRFFIIIPYQPEIKEKDFSLIKEQLKLNTDIITHGLEKLGMKTKQLHSLELLDLFYGFYNSDQLKTQALNKETIKALSQNYYV